MKITGINHVQLNCLDINAAKEFFVTAFDGKVLADIMNKDGVTVKGYMMEVFGGAVVELQPPRFDITEEYSAWAKVVFETENAEEYARRAAAAGAEILEIKKSAEGNITAVKILGPESGIFELSNA